MDHDSKHALLMSEVVNKVQYYSDRLKALYEASPQPTPATFADALFSEALLGLLVEGQEALKRLGVKYGSSAIPLILHCPMCRKRHIDEGEFATKRHHTHACQHCGFVWRPAVEDTVGVRFLPGYKNEKTK